VSAVEQPRHEGHEFLDQLYTGIEDGWVTTFSADRATGTNTTDWAPVGDLAGLVARAGARRNSCVWFGVATRRRRLEGKLRGGKAECALLPAMWVDLDVAGPNHADNEHLPPTLEEAVGMMQRFPLPPTVVVDTGGGLQAWWFLDEPTEADTALLERWGATWAQIGADTGYHVDNVFEAARIMRLPGTTNNKTDQAQPVRIVEADYGRRWGFDDIDQHLVEPPKPPETDLGRQVPYIGPERPGDAFNAVRTGNEILAAHGFELHHADRDGTQHWTRPGKDRRQGSSATVYPDGHTTIYSDTAAATWPAIETRRPYDPFGLYTVLAHGGDFRASSDELERQGYGQKARGGDDLRWMIGAAGRGPAATEPASAVEPDGWPTPTVLPVEPAPPSFPVGSLPVWAQAHAHAVAEQVQVPVDLVGMLMIGGLSAALTGRANVELSPNWQEPINLYLVTAMRSGAGKSPADKLTLAWLRRWQKGRIEAAIPLRKQAKLALEIAEKKLTDAKRAAAGSQDMAEANKALLAVEEAEEAVPVLPRLLIDDITPEQVVILLRAHGERLAIMSTEADLFDMVMKARGGSRTNVNVYLKAWSGDELTRDRKGGDEGAEWTPLENPLLTISVTVQPSVLAKLHQDAELVSRGFAARFMFSMPPDLIGRRDMAKRFNSDRLATSADYDAACTALADRWARYQYPATIRTTPHAGRMLLAFLEEVEPKLVAGGTYESLAEWASKLHGSIARYAAILHLAEGRDGQDLISVDTMARALELGRYWLAHARTVLHLNRDPTIERADTILKWIAATGKPTVSLRDVNRGVRRAALQLDRAEDYITPITTLCEMGWLRPLEAGDWTRNVGVRRAASPEFALWPKAVGSAALGGLCPECPVSLVEEEDSLSLPISPQDTPPYPPPRTQDTADISTERDGPPDDHAPQAPPDPSPSDVDEPPDAAPLLSLFATDDEDDADA